MTILLANTTFWDVVWWMVIMLFWVMAIWLFIWLFTDIFRRDDLSGWAKGGWAVLLFVLPFLGAIIYLCTRPQPSEQERRRLTRSSSPSGPHMGTQDIAQAHEMLKQGALTQAEFDEIKARALA